LALFKGLIVLKQAFTSFVFWLRFPINWLWRAFIKPLILFGYRFYLFGQRLIEILLEEIKEKTVGFFTSRHVVQSVMIILVFMVTATNIQAQDLVDDQSNSNQSVFSVSPEGISEDQLVEEVANDVPAVDSVSYLDGQAVNQNDYFSQGSAAGSENDTLIGEDGTGIDFILQAVRPMPETDDMDRPPTRTSVVSHTVAAGETVSSIAEEYGLKVQTVIVANDLGSRGLIKPGQTLTILPVDGIVYKVKKGDTLSKIAKTYKSDDAKIMEMNRLADAGDLAVGMELVLPDGRLPPPPAPARIASIKSIFVPPSTGSVSAGRLLWPAGVTRISQYYKRGHTGIDIAGPIGTPLYSAEDGVITYAGWNSGGYGNMIIVDHGNGLFTRYGHASKILVKVGDAVRRGEVIALMGSTGRSTGPHLHFEVMVRSVRSRVNPFSYLK